MKAEDFLNQGTKPAKEGLPSKGMSAEAFLNMPAEEPIVPEPITEPAAEPGFAQGLYEQGKRAVSEFFRPSFAPEPTVPVGMEGMPEAAIPAGMPENIPGRRAEISERLGQVSADMPEAQELMGELEDLKQMEYGAAMARPISTITGEPVPTPEERMPGGITEPGKFDFMDRAREIKEEGVVPFVPFVSGAKEVKDIARVSAAAYKLKEGTASPEEKTDLLEFVEKANRDTTFGYKVINTVAAMPAFMGEFLLTSGLYTVGRKVGTKAATKTLENYLGGVGRKLLEKDLGRIGVGIAGGVAGGTLQAPIMGAPRIISGTIERSMPKLKLSRDDEGEINAVIAGEGEDFLVASTMALGDQWAETVSEHSGGLFRMLNGSAKNAAIRAGLFSATMKANPGMSPNKVNTLFGKMAYHGVINEMLEERVGEGLRAGLGLQEYKIPTAEQLAVELVSFSVPGVIQALGARAFEKREVFERHTEEDRRDTSYPETEVVSAAPGLSETQRELAKEVIREKMAKQLPLIPSAAPVLAIPEEPIPTAPPGMPPPVGPPPAGPVPGALPPGQGFGLVEPAPEVKLRPAPPTYPPGAEYVAGRPAPEELIVEHKPILSTRGLPWKEEGNALKALRSREDVSPATHKVVKVKKGYGIVPFADKRARVEAEAKPEEVKGKTLIAFVRAMGGIKDATLPGEIRALSPKETGVVGLTTSIPDKGLGFDEMAAAAVEYGWLPENIEDQSGAFSELLRDDIFAQKEKKPRIERLASVAEKTEREERWKEFEQAEDAELEYFAKHPDEEIDADLDQWQRETIAEIRRRNEADRARKIEKDIASKVEAENPDLEGLKKDEGFPEYIEGWDEKDLLDEEALAELEAWRAGEEVEKPVYITVYRGIGDEKLSLNKKGSATFFADSEEVAETHAIPTDSLPYGEVVPYRIKMSNPLVVDYKSKAWDEEIVIDGEKFVRVYDVAKHAQKLGHDGLIAKNIYDSGNFGGGGEEGTTYAIFDPIQAESVEPIEPVKPEKEILPRVPEKPAEPAMSPELKELHDHKARVLGFEKAGGSFVEGYLKKLAKVAEKTDMPAAMAAYEALSEYKKGNIEQASLKAEKILGKLHKAEKLIVEKPPVKLKLKEKVIPFNDLDERAKGAIASDAMGKGQDTKEFINSRWIHKTVNIESLKDKNKSVWSDSFVYRKSETKGPLIVAADGEILDGNNRLREAIERKDKQIDILERIEKPKPKEKITAEMIRAALPEAVRKLPIDRIAADNLEYVYKALDTDYATVYSILKAKEKPVKVPAKAITETTSYDEMMEWIDEKAKEYDGKNKFYASPEYAAIYPVISKIKTKQEKYLQAEAKKAMAEMGVVPGDRVEYVTVMVTGIEAPVQGNLYLDKKGIPKVKTDEGKVVTWNKGWKKISKKPLTSEEKDLKEAGEIAESYGRHFQVVSTEEKTDEVIFREGIDAWLSGKTPVPPAQVHGDKKDNKPIVAKRRIEGTANSFEIKRAEELAKETGNHVAIVTRVDKAGIPTARFFVEFPAISKPFKRPTLDAIIADRWLGNDYTQWSKVEKWIEFPGKPKEKLKEPTFKIGSRVRSLEGSGLPSGKITHIDSEGRISIDGSRHYAPRDFRFAERPVVPLPEAPPRATPDMSLARWVKYELNQRHSITWRDLYKAADMFHGGTQAEGKYTSRQAFDAMELGMNLWIQEHIEKGMDPVEAIKLLDKKQGALATQTKRTKEQVEYQQFSTPPTHSRAMAWVANIGPNDVILEPSAGTGSLVIQALVDKPAEVIANELSARRAKLLENLGIKVYKENAAHLNAVLPAEVKPTVVLMNPPFSSDILLKGKKKTTGTGAEHIEQALMRLEEGGRLVALAGRGMALDKPAFRAWWKGIRDKYTVRAVIGISGKEYKKYGTDFDNVLIVIDKTGRPTVTERIVVDSVDKVEDVVPLLEGIHAERTAARKPEARKPVGIEGVEGAEGGLEPRVPVPPSVTKVGVEGEKGGRGEGLLPGAPGRGRVPGRVEPGGGVRVPSEGRPILPGEPGREEIESEKPGTPPREPTTSPDVFGGRGVSDKKIRRDTTPDVEFEENKPTGKSGELTDSLFEDYTPSIKIKGSQKHPAPMAESAAMAAVEAPAILYKPKIPKNLITSGKLSDIQFEFVARTGDVHSQILPDGKRAGIMLGDGTGSGKGAQIAGVILDNWNHGRKKAVWISENMRLARETKRDIDWVGMNSKRLVFTPKVGEKIKKENGVLYITYATLGKVTQDKQDRISQLVDWLGEDFDGVIAFDECHNMRNSIELQGVRGGKTPSKKALAGIELQKRLTNARIIYSSATCATEVSNFAYADRLGLWGEGTAFATKRDFITSIQAGGVAAMEVVAGNLKSMGRMVARTLAYNVPGNPDHTVTYETLVHKVTKNDKEVYNEMARAWQIVLENIDDALVLTGESPQAKSNAMGQFWGAQQRFFNQVLTSLPVPTLIKDIEKKLASGESCIIQLVNTNEALLNRRRAQAEEAGLDLEDIDLTPRDMLIQFLEKSFPVKRWEEYYDEASNSIKSRVVVDSEGKPVVDPEAVRMRDDLIKRLASLQVPETIIERVINHFGSDNVAELTGRSKRLVRQPDGTVKEERLGVASKRKDHDAFMGGEKRILIFSYAGGTGAGYHSDLLVKNQEKRNHYLTQPGWIADKALQGFGRSHRTGQRVAPHDILVTTDVAAHKRFFSSIARRLDQVGALTKGERRTTGQGMFSAEMNLENEYADMALSTLFRDLQGNRVPGLDLISVAKQMGFGDISEKEGDLTKALDLTIQKFLNRMLSMEIDEQNKLFDAFFERLEAQIQYAVDQGIYESGIETLRAEKIEKASEQNIDMPVGRAKYTKLAVTRKLFTRAYKDLEGLVSFRETDSHFLRNKRSGRIYFVRPAVAITEASGEIRRRVVRESPVSRNYMNMSDVTTEKYEEIPKGAKAKKLWDEQLNEFPKTTTQETHIISGALLPIWDRLPRGMPKIIRVKTEDGDVLLGREISDEKIDDVRKALRLDAEGRVAITEGDALDALLDQEAVLQLANGWTIRIRTVSGEDRIEIMGPTGAEIDMLESFGAFSEIISYKTRIFVPTDRAKEIVGRIIKNKPVVGIVGPKGRAVPSNIINRLLENERGSSEFINDLSRLGVDVMRRGHTKFKDFSAETQKAAGSAWDKIKSLIRKAFFMAKQILKSERGAIEIGKPKPKPEVGREVISKDGTTVDWKRSITLLKQKVYGTYKKDGSFDKWRTREAINKIKALKKAEVKYKERLGKAKEKFDVRVEKIKTVKEILTRRREKIKAIKDYFLLSDSDLRKITRKDIRLMSNFEFKQFIDDIRVKAERFAERRQALNELELLRKEKAFIAENNIRIFHKLPTIKKMTTEQLTTYAEILSGYEKGDQFLTPKRVKGLESTPWSGSKTMREVLEKASKEFDVPLSELKGIRVDEIDRFRYDTSLARRNPFYNFMIDTINTAAIRNQFKYFKEREKLYRLAKAALKSRKRGIIGRLVPRQKELMKYMEAEGDAKLVAATELTTEEMALADAIEDFYRRAYNWLLINQELKSSRFIDSKYVFHSKRPLSELLIDLKDTGIRSAVKDLLNRWRLDEAQFKILDSKTGEILRMKKFFRQTLYRTGELTPTKNVIKATDIYMQQFFKKMALDESVPAIETLVMALRPKEKTPTGIFLNDSLMTLVKEYLNSKKGRALNVGIQQGGKIDTVIRFVNQIISLRYIALNIPLELAAIVGETTAKLPALGNRKLILANMRRHTPRGRRILEKYKAFTGEGPFEEVLQPARNIGENINILLYGLFKWSRKVTKQDILLGNMTREEFLAETIDPKKLAEATKMAGRWLDIEGSKSVLGTTSTGAAITKFRGWAIPIVSSTMHDATALARTLTRLGDPKKRLNKQQAQELYRIAETGAIVLAVMSLDIDDDDKDTFVGRLIHYLIRELGTNFNALSSRTMLTFGVTIAFLEKLSQNLYLLMTLEKYKTKDELKGVAALKKQLTPAAISQFKEKKKPEPKVKKGRLKGGLTGGRLKSRLK